MPRLRTLLVSSLASILLAPAPTLAAGPAGGVLPGRSPSQFTFDTSTRIDANQIGCFVTNFGSFGWDIPDGVAGLEYPRGTGNTALFAGGLWIGAQVAAQTRVTVAEYSFEFVPGGALGEADGPQLKVYKLMRFYPDVPTRDAALADYNSGAVPHGAPPVVVLGDGSLSIPGDQFLWDVFNDGNPAFHTALPGSTPPLGVVVRHKTWAYNQPGPLGRTVFLEYEIRNAGANLLQNTYVGLWTDPDLGGATDDLVGSNPPSNLGYCYNATNSDFLYGSSPPAIGIDVLRGPASDGGPMLPMTSFIKYINGTDPDNATKSCNPLKGLNADGTTIIDPVASAPTTFMVPGDPITQTGWVDSNPADRRMSVNSGPFTLAPGASKTVRYAIVIGQGADRFSSIQDLIVSDAAVKAFDAGGPTAIEVSPVDSHADASGAHLAWLLAGGTIESCSIERSEAGAGWSAVASAVPDGTGRVEYADASVLAGHRYGYRVAYSESGATRTGGETWIDIPASTALAVLGARPNPAQDRLLVALALPDDRPATLALIDVSGRIVRTQTLSGPAAIMTVDLGATRGLAAGLYFVKLTHAGESRVGRVSIVR